LIKLVWLRWKVQEWLVLLVLPKTFEVLSQENVNVVFYTASSEHSICIGILNSDDTKSTV
jgi:aspartokinase